MQKIFLKHILYKCRMTPISYKEDCRRLGLLTLEERRNLLDVYFLYDIVNGNIDCPDLVQGISYGVPKRRTRHTKLLHIPRRHSKYAANSVLTRLPRVYNDTFVHIDPFRHSKQSFKYRAYNLVKDT